jgi:hypothetical protein
MVYCIEPPPVAGAGRAAGPAATHAIRCPRCGTEFDLFAAAWCEHIGIEPSKICPWCRLCVCDHPAYDEPHFWKEAPAGFQKRGFRNLFLLYL